MGGERLKGKKTPSQASRTTKACRGFEKIGENVCTWGVFFAASHYQAYSGKRGRTPSGVHFLSAWEGFKGGTVCLEMTGL